MHSFSSPSCPNPSIALVTWEIFSLLCDSLPSMIIAAFKHPREMFTLLLTNQKSCPTLPIPYKLIASPTQKIVLGKQFSFPFGKLRPRFRNSFVGGVYINLYTFRTPKPLCPKWRFWALNIWVITSSPLKNEGFTWVPNGSHAIPLSQAEVPIQHWSSCEKMPADYGKGCSHTRPQLQPGGSSMWWQPPFATAKGAVRKLFLIWWVGGLFPNPNVKMGSSSPIFGVNIKKKKIYIYISKTPPIGIYSSFLWLMLFFQCQYYSNHIYTTNRIISKSLPPTPRPWNDGASLVVPRSLRNWNHPPFSWGLLDSWSTSLRVKYPHLPVPLPRCSSSP